MRDSFLKKYDFNQDLVAWNTSKVTSFQGAFYQTSFNQDISPWIITSATNTYGMFQLTSAFNQELCWDLAAGVFTDYVFASSSGSASVQRALLPLNVLALQASTTTQLTLFVQRVHRAAFLTARLSRRAACARVGLLATIAPNVVVPRRRPLCRLFPHQR